VNGGRQRRPCSRRAIAGAGRAACVVLQGCGGSANNPPPVVGQPLELADTLLEEAMGTQPRQALPGPLACCRNLSCASCEFVYLWRYTLCLPRKHSPLGHARPLILRQCSGPCFLRCGRKTRPQDSRTRQTLPPRSMLRYELERLLAWPPLTRRLLQ
jgi:hypothetical protein